MSNRKSQHRRLLAAGIGALVALPSSFLMGALWLAGTSPGIEGLALFAPATGAVVGLLLGAGVQPSPSPFPAARVVVASLLAVPLGAPMVSVLLVGPLWTAQPLTAVVETALYSLSGVVIYGWLVVLLTLPSAIVGAVLMQRLLARLATTDMFSTSDRPGAPA